MQPSELSPNGPHGSPLNRILIIAETVHRDGREAAPPAPMSSELDARAKRMWLNDLASLGGSDFDDLLPQVSALLPDNGTAC